MRRVIVLFAAGLVLVADAWVLISAARNRGSSPGGTVELTERELRLPPMVGESTAILLELDWEVIPARGRGPQGRASPEWLDQAKLEELGFDCSLPVTHPDARRRYRFMTGSSVYLVLEYQGESWGRADPGRQAMTRLFAVDAGRNPKHLREKYPDSTRYIITRGVVWPFLEERPSSGAKQAAEPRLRGRVDIVIPNQIFVPLPHSRVLAGLRDRATSEQRQRGAAPRFAVTISWGASYEPRVVGARLLSSQEVSYPSNPHIIELFTAAALY